MRARRDAVPASVRRFSARARRRRARAARPWFAALVLLALVGAGAGLVLATPLLGVERIHVDGAVLVTPEEARLAAGVDTGTPLVRVDLDAVSRRVEALPPVQDAIVTRSWPRALTIRIVERSAVAVAPVPGGYVVIDAGGVPFDSLSTAPADLPRVKLAAPGPDDPTTRAALTVLAALNDQLRGLLATLVAEAPTRVRLELRDGRTVIWGDATENEAKARVATAFLARPGTVIDVSVPDVVTVR